ncbi:MAG: signal peptidase I [Ruminococcus sp.]|nr:signal peptidase I [Ruminococcus sp.]
MEENNELHENTAEEQAEEIKSAEEISEEEKKEAEKAETFVSDLLEIAESAIITVFVMFMVFTYLLHPVNVVGHSMQPTLNPHPDVLADGTESSDRILMTMVYGKPKYGDILIIDCNDNYLLDGEGNPYIPDGLSSLNECIIKRVIAAGGQTIDIRNNTVTVDGEVLPEPYVASTAQTNDLGGFTGQYPITVPEGYVFVMGDNREHSTDSRSARVGLVKESQIYGKALVRYYPTSDFKILTSTWKESADEKK